MAYKFNVFTGTLDYFASPTTSNDVSYMQVPNRISIRADSNFSIRADSGSRIFVQDFSRGFEIIGSIFVYLGGRLSIESNAKGTIRGV